jgi:predicted ATPase
MEEETNSRFYVITGGPGAGKTTLIHALRKRGYICVDEAARKIIQEQMSTGGDALPWSNVKRYKEMMLNYNLQSYCKACNQGDKITFFDRSIFDLIDYDRRTKLQISSDLQHAVQQVNFNKKVFITPPWKEIFCNDDERKQTFMEAIAIHNSISEVYVEWGFQLIELPKKSVEARVDFILNHI